MQFLSSTTKDLDIKFTDILFWDTDKKYKKDKNAEGMARWLAETHNEGPWNHLASSEAEEHFAKDEGRERKMTRL